MPSTGDSVIGVVAKKFPENYAVDVGASVPATLSAYAFEGATKRNRPAINVNIKFLTFASLIHFASAQ